MTDDELIAAIKQEASYWRGGNRTRVLLLMAADRIAQLTGEAEEPSGSDLLAIYGKPLTTVNTDGLRAVWRAGRLSVTPHAAGEAP